jgi:hypothetical protein
MKTCDWNLCSSPLIESSFSDNYSFAFNDSNQQSIRKLKEETLESLIKARETFVKAESGEARSRWQLRCIAAELNLISRAQLNASNFHRSVRYEALEKLKGILEQSRIGLETEVEEYVKLKVKMMESFKDLRQRYYEMTKELVDFPNTDEARDFLHRAPEVRPEIKEVVDKFISNPSGRANESVEYSSGGIVSDDQQTSYDFNLSEINLYEDATNKDFSKLLKSKLETTRNLLSRQKSSNPLSRQASLDIQERQINDFSEIDFVSDSDTDLISLDINDDIFKNASTFHSTRLYLPSRDEDLLSIFEESTKPIDENEILGEIEEFRKLLEERNSKVESIHDTLMSKRHQADEQLKKIHKIQTEFLTTERNFKENLIDFERGEIQRNYDGHREAVAEKSRYYGAASRVSVKF